MLESQQSNRINNYDNNRNINVEGGGISCLLLCVNSVVYFQNVLAMLLFCILETSLTCFLCTVYKLHVQMKKK